MTYTAFRDTVRSTLQSHPNGLTWQELRQTSQLPYQRACPEWTKRLERDIGLNRSAKRGNALIWKL